jgi:iron complex transport system substrate-binding protein
VTSSTFIGQIYTLLGLKDIADAAKGAGSGYPKLSAEYIVASSPDLIVLADSVCCGQTPAKVEARPGWSTIAAVKRHDVLAVNDDVASRWGPRVVTFMRDVANAARSATR